MEDVNEDSLPQGESNEQNPSTVNVMNLAGNIGKGLMVATSNVVSTVHTAAKTSVKTGMEGVLGPSEESIREMEK